MKKLGTKAVVFSVFSFMLLVLSLSQVIAQEPSDSIRVNITKEATDMGKAPKGILPPEGEKEQATDSSTAAEQRKRLSHPKGGWSEKLTGKEIQNVQIEVKTEGELKFLQDMGLKCCPGLGMCACEITLEQFDQIKAQRINIKRIREEESQDENKLSLTRTRTISIQVKTPEDLQFFRGIGLDCCVDTGICKCRVTQEQHKQISAYWRAHLQDTLQGGKETKPKSDKIIPPKPKPQTKEIFLLKVKLKTDKEMEVIKRIGMQYHFEGDQLMCKATQEQMEELKKEGIEFEVVKEGLRIQGRINSKGSVYDCNENDYNIPDNDGWVASPITISSAPSGAIVTRIDVSYEIIHTYIGDLIVDLTDQDLTYEYRLWNREGGSGDNISDWDTNITTFNGELVNQTWYLWAIDMAAGDVGYIDCFDITIWYQEAFPDLIVQSLTATNYNPNVGDYIDVAMVIKNQGIVPAADWFCNGLYYNLSSPPDIYTIEDDWWSAIDLDPGESETHTFYNITSSQAGTWRMYGLADCDGEITETNENNNYLGPVTINWIYSPPDLIVQNLTVENSSLIITEHTNGTITIKNQSSVPVTDWFYTDVFKNRDYAPSPPATGEYFWQEYSLNPGQTRTYNFYKLPHSTSAGTWKMWGLVDSDGDIAESNENNNAYGPLNITWLNPPSPHEVSRPTMIDHGLEFVNVNWTCSSDNVDPHWSCPNNWRCWFTPGHSYTGEAYSWGGWDKPNTDFLTYLSAGLCVGSIKDSTCGAVDPYWATGVDCAGLVSRCWETNARKDCSGLVYISDQITINDLRSGDIMNRTGEHAHVRMFYQWKIPNSWMTVIEATPFRCRTWDYNTDTLLNQGYVPRKYKYVIDPDQHDPVIVGHIHCKYPQTECGDCIEREEQITIELDAYDPDGDPIHYEWYADWGWFIVNGQYVYACTTAENYVTYEAPGFPFSQDRLDVIVRDDRGGSASIIGSVGIYAEGTKCLCGDFTKDLIVDASDLIFLLDYLFVHGPSFDPTETGDVNNDCVVVDVSDLMYLLNYLFAHGPQPECCWIRY